MTVKRCGNAARFVVIEDPKAPNPFCKEHGPERYIKGMGFLYRKAKGGEKCGQIADVEKASLDALKTWGESGDPGKALQTLRKAFPKNSPARHRKENARIKGATLDMLKKVEATGNLDAGMREFQRSRGER